MPRRFDFETNHWIEDNFLAVPKRKAAPDRELPEPDVAPSLGRWHRPSKPMRRIDPRTVATYGLYAMFLASVGFLGEGERAVGFVAVFVAGFFGVRRLRSRGDLPEADLRLLEDRDDPDVCLVDIRVVCDGVLSGEDRGVAWFEKGRLVYNGHRTSFAVGGEDVLPKSAWSEYIDREGQMLLPENALPLRTLAARHYVVFTPLHRLGPVGADQRSRFGYRFSRFRRLPTLATGARQWPPFIP